MAQQPFALQARDPRRGWRVMASNGPARRLRIYPGMSISEATAILPSLRLIDYDPQEDLAGLIELAQAAWQFSPIVGLEKPDAQPWAGRSLHEPQAFFLEADGLTHLFDGSESMLLRLNDWLCSQGYVACLAMAPSPGAAWALANYAHRRRIETEPATSDNPFISIVESPALLPSHIAGFPIEALRLDIKTVQTLHQLGIRTVEALVRLPRAGLAGRLGETLLQRLDAAYHGRSEVVGHLKADMLCSAEMALEFPTLHRATLEEILRRLVEQLCRQLREHAHGALRVTTCLRPEKGPAHLLSLGLYRATADERHMARLLLGQLEHYFEAEHRKPSSSFPRPILMGRKAGGERTSVPTPLSRSSGRGAGGEGPNIQTNTPLRSPITLVELTATLTAPLVWKQTELFDQGDQRHRETMAQSIDMLASRLGRKQVVAPQIQKHPQPELVCRWRPLTGQRHDGSSQSTKRKLPRSRKPPTSPEHLLRNAVNASSERSKMELNTVTSLQGRGRTRSRPGEGATVQPLAESTLPSKTRCVVPCSFINRHIQSRFRSSMPIACRCFSPSTASNTSSSIRGGRSGLRAAGGTRPRSAATTTALKRPTARGFGSIAIYNKKPGIFTEYSKNH